MIRILVFICFISQMTTVALSADKFIQTQELSRGWKFRQVGDSTWYSAIVPGVVHTDLYRNGLIGNPYWENNEIDQQWVEEKDWEYKLTFNVSDGVLQNSHVELNFEGLDTYATVWLNNNKVLRANNMFRGWQVDVRKILKTGQNTLRIQFESPLKVNKTAVEENAYKLPSGCETGPLQVGSFTRKAAYHFGWDWGPRFVTAGIWKPVELKAWNEARITNVNCQTISISDSLALVKVEIEIESARSFKSGINISINERYKYVKLNKGMNIIIDTLRVNDPKLWWSNGLGKANLYNLDIVLRKNEDIINQIQKKYGIRTIELINEPDSIGTSFYFKLNGIPVFMKGANYIPQDMFLPSVSEARYRNIIDKVKYANMNMLRVWGGGIYENDIFYDLCDENGILVWQDFMFAGSLYPGDPEFIENIESEVYENIKRLRHHPSIALWCGNNEIEVAWKNWGWQKKYNYSLSDSIEIWNNYKKIFQQLIPNALKTLHPQGSYTSTSPLSNWGTPSNFNHSSMHYWGVWHGKDNFDQFDDNIGRFMVEYGFQSFPSITLLRTIANDSNLNLNSNVMANRQKSYVGNGMILKQIEQYFESPTNFADFIVLSQKVQAMAYKLAITAHINNQPHCMGTLFWQLNDCWPCPSWSVIEYDGTEKEAYEVIKDLFGTPPNKAE